MSSLMKTRYMFVLLPQDLREGFVTLIRRDEKKLHGKVASKMGQICYRLTCMELSNHARDAERAGTERGG